MQRRNWQVTITDSDGETQEYRVIARDVWNVVAHIDTQMSIGGDFYGHKSAQTTTLKIAELVAGADMSNAIQISDRPSKVVDFDIEDCGIDHAQYFNRGGVVFTDYTDFAIGAGDDVREAYEDAVEQLAQSWDDVSILPDIWPAEEDMEESPSVSKEYPDSEDMHYYVVVRVR